MSFWGDVHRRAVGDEVRAEDKPNWSWLHFEVNLNPTPSNLLTESEEASIVTSALAQFKFGKFESLDGMLSELGVTLKISSKTPEERSVPDAISEWALYWENELKRLKALGIKEGPLYEEAKKEAEKAGIEATNWSKMPVLGCYDRYSKTIYLYPNNMDREAKEKNSLPEEARVIKKKYLVTTFVHEAMHAYFDRHHHELFPYVATVEEPLAEFGMLLFLYEAKDKEGKILFADIYDGAKEEVGSKKTCYRYGAALMDSYEKGNAQIRQAIRSDLEAYKRKTF